MLTEDARRVNFEFESVDTRLNPLSIIKRWKQATIDRLRHIDVANEIVPGKPLPDMEDLWNNDQDDVVALEREQLTVRYGFNESELWKVFYKRHKGGDAEGLTAQMRDGIRDELTKRRELRSRVPGQHNHNHVRRKRWDRSTPEIEMLQDFVSCIVRCLVCTLEPNICP